MSVEIKVPVLPESVSDATIATWHKKPGEPVSQDENIVDIETDKVVLEVVAPADGALEAIIKKEGDTVGAEEIIAKFSVGGSKAAPTTEKAEVAVDVKKTESAPSSAPAAQGSQTEALSPAVRRMIAEHNLDPNQIKGSGKEGRITKQDVEAHLGNGDTATAAAPASQTATATEGMPVGERVEKRVPMTRLRARIAERLLSAQQNAAILTTFNEINMQPATDLRKEYKDQFEKKHGVRLGFMSFFTMAAVEALKRYPEVNASIDGNEIVYHGYCDIGIAVSSPRGLVVPILRNAEQMDMATIEKTIRGYGEKAQAGKLTLEEMTGGTFTISNGGVFGSLMSTPILNPPQSAILGMHKMEQRPVVEDGQIVIRPMMYVALSYDHRIIDGAESVGFLLTIKQMLEDPARLLLGV